MDHSSSSSSSSSAATQDTGPAVGEVDEEEEDWFVADLQRRPPSLQVQLGIGSPKKGGGSTVAASSASDDMAVVWGGQGASSTGVDMEAQEAILSRLFKPHKVKQYMQQQQEVADSMVQLRRLNHSSFGAAHKVHQQLRIVSGSAAGRQLRSSQGEQTRPMMEKVRQAIFNLIQSQASSVSSLPAGSRWLDLFAGTGSVGLEAMSRGCGECHFVEMDPWVTRNILGKNITTCGFQRSVAVHSTKAEDFLRKSIALPRFAGGAFDFISVCPPYLLVSYPELFDLLARSPLLHASSIVFVEYPKQLAQQVPATLGPLGKVRDRKYGRTYIAVYANAGDDSV